jgi:hypothetical protein
MTFKSTCETLSEASIDSSDAFPAGGVHVLGEAELDGVAGGMINQDGPGHLPSPDGGPFSHPGANLGDRL